MGGIACFCYREGIDFAFQGDLARVNFAPSPFFVPDGRGLLVLDPSLFRPVQDPSRADVFLFPFDIGTAIDAGFRDAIEALIADLPFFPGRAERHIIVDIADSPQSVRLDVALFKMSVMRSGDPAGKAVVLWYDVPPHVLARRPTFDIEHAEYDTCFIGTYSHVARLAAVHSVRRHAPTLRFYEKGEHNITVRDGFFYTARHDAHETAVRQRRYVHTIQRSLTVLCPPGVGPQSVRMYETMYLGRIPVLFDYDVAYPFEDRIDYRAFTLMLPQDDMLGTAGPMLEEWLRGQSTDRLRERCALAAKTWRNWFAKPDRLRLMLEEGARVFGLPHPGR
ncbi:MAG: glycosyltransferase family 47 protein [Desulfovibrio sp.]|jgi:hypothetical protein|nr:glycosyltransferase family 47 protein [Desulfovibrio sp.]